jgi:hypothetical protein
MDHDPRPCYQMGVRYGSIPLHGGDGGYVDGEDYVGKKPTTAKTRYAQKPDSRVQ